MQARLSSPLVTRSDVDSPESEADGAQEWRAGEDRRQRPTPMFSRYLLRGKRRGGRRDDERDQVYVDRPGPWIWMAFVAVVGLSALDAIYTLDLLGAGKAVEANPVMRAALHLGTTEFVVIKTTMTLLAVGFLCLHKNWPLGRFCLAAAILGYSTLVVYHLIAQHYTAKLPASPPSLGALFY